MKRILFITAFLAFTVYHLSAQSKPYKVVFDLTSKDTLTHQRVIRWINGITKSHPDAEIEVVFYGKSLPMVETEQSTVTTDIKKLAAAKNIKFAVCEQAMKVHQVEKGMLLPGVKTVPDALYELVTKQAEGFGYIKVTD